MILEADFMTYISPFCDWLNVMCETNAEQLDAIEDLISCAGWMRNFRFYKYGGALWVGLGPIVFKDLPPVNGGPGTTSISLSGSVLRGLCEVEEYIFMLSLLGQVPYWVTCMDFALDVFTDPAAHLGALMADGFEVRLGRKVAPRRAFLTDGQGFIVYFGARLAHIKVRVYDKSAEMRARHYVEIPPTLRVELTVERHVRLSLKDAAVPQALFWHYCGVLFSKSAHVPSWAPLDAECVMILARRGIPDPALNLRRVLECMDLGLLARAMAKVSSAQREFYERRLLESLCRAPIGGRRDAEALKPLPVQ